MYISISLVKSNQVNKNVIETENQIFVNIRYKKQIRYFDFK